MCGVSGAAFHQSEQYSPSKRDVDEKGRGVDRIPMFDVYIGFLEQTGKKDPGQQKWNTDEIDDWYSRKDTRKKDEDEGRHASTSDPHETLCPSH